MLVPPIQTCKEGFVLEGTSCVKCISEEFFVTVPPFGIAFLTLASTTVAMSVVVVCVKVRLMEECAATAPSSS